MSILSGVFRCVKRIKLKDGFQKTSEWQQAQDVELNDGTNAQTKFDSLNNSVKSLNTDLVNHNHDGRYYTEAEVNTLLAKKQSTLLNNTYVSTNTTNASGVITLGIDISTLGLTTRPKCAFLQGQNSGIYSLERYIYSYDNSTTTRIVFVVNYGVPNTQITDRYGFVVFP